MMKWIDVAKKQKKGIWAGVVVIAVLLILAAFGHKMNGSTEETIEETTEEIIDESIDKPYGCKISNITDAGIEVYWKNTEYADGYKVYRSYSEDTGYECITEGDDFADATERSHSTYTDANFDHNKKTVYYKVRSWEYDDNNNVIYSAFSKTLTAEYVSSLNLNCTQLYLPAGMSRKIQANYGWGNPDDACWTSDDEAVAVVDDAGIVTAVAKGTCTIICSSKEAGGEQRCAVTIDREPLSPLEEISSRYVQTQPTYWENPDAEASGSAVIMMTGDMMCTSAQQKKLDGGTGDYNFNESFSLVKDVLADSDLAIGNLETLLASAWPYMREEAYIDNKPNCNAPTRYLDALKYAGFDGLVMSNNHNCDGGEAGAIETVQAVEDYEFAHTGLFTSEEDERTLLIAVNGIKVGILSYTPKQPGFNGKDADWPQESIDTILNYYEKEKAEADIAELRSRGAEYIIAYVHWGVKNVFGIKDNQREVAQELADFGVDYLVGGHSHVIQPYEEITASDGRIVPCFYSLGDFNSSVNQVAGNRDSVILRIRLVKNEEGEVELAENAYIPCYTRTNYKDMNYVTIPLNESLNGGATFKKFEKFRNRIAQEVGDILPEYIPAS